LTTLGTHATRTALVFALLDACAGPVLAQTGGSTQPPVRPAPAEASERTRLTWSVSERVRYSGLLNQFRPGLSGDDQALVFRTAFRVDLALPHLMVVGEAQDSRAYLTDEQSNVSTALVNAVDLLQAYVVFGRTTNASAVRPEVQLGRFSMELGSGRLIAQEAYRDVARTFTGVKVRWRPTSRGTLTAFAALPVLTLPDDRDSLLHNRIAPDEEHLNLKLWGALHECDRLWLRSRGELYLYTLREHDDPAKRETRDRKLWTIGGRLYRVAAANVFDFDTEAAWQGGRAHASTAASDVRSLDVAAHYLHLNGGYTFARSWSPRVAVEYDYGSGDSNPADGQWNRFDSLFGNRRVDLAPTSIYGALGRENIDTLGIRASIAPSSRIDAFSVFRVVRLAAAADAFASTGVRDPTGRSGTDGGRQIDLRLRAWIIPASVRVEVGATHLIDGHFLRVAPNATREGNSTFFYGDVTYTFGSK
jgi:hypothetical protein